MVGGGLVGRGHFQRPRGESWPVWLLLELEDLPVPVCSVLVCISLGRGIFSQLPYTYTYHLEDGFADRKIHLVF